MSKARLLPAETIRQIAEANSIEEMIGEDVTLKRVGSSWVGLCPFHAEKTPSFNVAPTRQRFMCFGCGKGGDIYGYIMARDEIRFFEAARILARRVGIQLDGAVAQTNPLGDRSCARRPVAPQTAKVLWMPRDLRAPTRADLQIIAKRRGLPIAGLELAAVRGLLRWASPNGVAAWIVTDTRRVNAQARRMDGGLWKHIGDKKTWTLTGSRAAWPLGTQEAVDKPCVVLTEGGPDLLAAHAFIAAEGRENDVAAVTVLGGGIHLPDDALQLLAGKRVRLFPHLDPVGQGAAVRWTRQLERVDCRVDAFRFDGLLRTDGMPVNDLNDLAMIDAECFEGERHNLEGIFP